MQIDSNTLALIQIYIPIHLFLLYLIFRLFWRIYKSLPGIQHFRFHLVELMAACIAFAPTVFIVAEGIEHTQSSQDLSANIIFIMSFLVAVSQVCGLLIGHIQNVVSLPTSSSSTTSQAAWIFAGGLFGLLLVPAGIIASVIFLVLLPFLIVALPLYLVIKALSD